MHTTHTTHPAHTTHTTHTRRTTHTCNACNTDYAENIILRSTTHAGSQENSATLKIPFLFLFIVLDGGQNKDHLAGIWPKQGEG